MDARPEPAPKGSNASLWVGAIAALLVLGALAIGFVWLVVRAVSREDKPASESSGAPVTRATPPASADAAPHDPRPALPPNVTTAPKPSPIRGRTFDADEGDAEVAVAAAKVSKCKGPPSGKGRAQVVFGPGGNVVAVYLTAPFATSFVAPCIEVALRSARVPPYDGDAQRVKTGDDKVFVNASFTVR